MRYIFRTVKTPFGVFLTTCMAMILLIACFFVTQVHAASGNDLRGGRLVAIHDRGNEKVILTKARSVKDALKDAHINLDENDRVEPGLHEKLTATSSTVNIYRARPVVVVDGVVRQKVMTAQQTPQQIAKDAGLELHKEDKTILAPSSDLVSDGAGLQLIVFRATAFTLVLYGKKTTAYTQEKTVGEMLRAKRITPQKDDTVSVGLTTKMTNGLTVEVWRNGLQSVTEEQDIPFDTQQTEDATKDVNYKQIQTPGENGRRTVTYEVEMRNGKEVSRKETGSTVTKVPKKQVVIVGSKPSFSGDFAAALAKLRSCEGGYTSVNPAGYYGAYQFTQSAWNSNAPAGYAGINPTKAPPAVQDQAARNYYVKSGWRPWPNCGKALPDIYR